MKPRLYKLWHHRVMISATVLALVLYFAMMTHWFSAPRSWQSVSGLIQLPPEQWQRPPLPPQAPQIQWLGHAGFLLKWHGKTIALDPNLSSQCKMVKRAAAVPAIDWNTRLDAVLISHLHYDHLDLPTLMKLPPAKTVAATTGAGSLLKDVIARGTHYRPIGPGDHWQLGRLTITVTTALHGGARNHPWSSKKTAHGYIISDGHYTVFFAGDTAYGPHFTAIGQRFKPDLALLPIGAYEPHFLLGKHHLNPQEAVQAAIDLQVQWVVPCHFGTFRLALEPLDAALPKFAAIATREGLQWTVPTAYSHPSSREPSDRVHHLQMTRNLDEPAFKGNLQIINDDKIVILNNRRSSFLHARIQTCWYGHQLPGLE